VGLHGLVWNSLKLPVPSQRIARGPVTGGQREGFLAGPESKVGRMWRLTFFKLGDSVKGLGGRNREKKE